MKKMNKIKFCFVLTICLMLTFVLCACVINDKPSNGNTPVIEPTVEMTESYKLAREEFKKVTGIELPELADLEVDDFPFEDGDTSYCFDIIDGKSLNYETYLVLEQFALNLLGQADSGFPRGDEETGRTVEWTIELRWYQLMWDSTNKAIYINTYLKQGPVDSEMTESYREGREAFLRIVGILLPEKANIELLASSSFSDTYHNACFDMPGDQALYNEFLAYLMQANGFNPSASDEESASWNYNLTENGKLYNRWITLIYDKDNNAVYVNGGVSQMFLISVTTENQVSSVELIYNEEVVEGNTANLFEESNVSLKAIPGESYEFKGWYVDGVLVSTDNPLNYVTEAKDVCFVALFEELESGMTESYKQGRQQFYQISNLLLPEIEDVELSDESSFNVEKKSARFVVGIKDGLYDALVAGLKEEMIKYPLADNNNHHEEEGFMIFWEWDYEDGGRFHKVTIWAQKDRNTIEVGYVFRDYFTLTLTATEGGSVELRKSGRPDDDNILHACEGTYVDLYATPSDGFEFDGWYIDGVLLDTEEHIDYKIFADVEIQGVFTELQSNMTDSYKAARENIYQMSELLLPQYENVEATNSVFAEGEEGTHTDEAQTQLVFTSGELALAGYNEIKQLLVAAYGNPAIADEGESMLMLQWSVLFQDAPVPYRIEVMMNYRVDSTSINFMWREQPIINITVTYEGPGEAHGVYFDMVAGDIVEVPYTYYFEIKAAFHGTLVAIPDEGMQFDGWYVNDELVSNDLRFTFDYKAPNFIDITFKAVFSQPKPVEMTESYAGARTSLNNVSGILLPELEAVTAMFEELSSGQYMIDVSGATDAIFTTIKDAFTSQTNINPSQNEFNMDVWDFTSLMDGETTAQLRCFFDSGLVVIFYEEFVEESDVTESYAKARDEFYAVTGVMLPDMEGLEVDEYPYNEGDTSYCFDITSGDNLSQKTFEVFLAFFDEELSSWMKEEVSDGGYSNINYNSVTGDWIGLTWDSYNSAVYINALMSNVSVYDTFSDARIALASINGVTIPEYENVTLEWCSFKEDGSETTFGFSCEDFSESTYSEIETIFNDLFGEYTSKDEYEGYIDTYWLSDAYNYSVSWDPDGHTIDINMTTNH